MKQVKLDEDTHRALKLAATHAGAKTMDEYLRELLVKRNDERTRLHKQKD